MDTQTLGRAVVATLGAILLASSGQAQVATVSPDRGWIGISVEIRTSFEERGRGQTVVSIADVHPDSPAWASGVRPGDLLVSINGRSYERGFTELARSLSPGDPVALVVTRDGRPQRIQLTASARPVAMIAPPEWTVVVRTDTVAERMFRAMDSLRIRVLREGPQAVVVTPRSGDLHDAPLARPGRTFRFPDPDTLEGRVLVSEPGGPLAGLRLRAGALDSLRAEIGRLEEEILQTGRAAASAPELFRPLAPYALGRNRAAGAEVVELRPELADYFGVAGGVLVVDVPAGTPAAGAGVLPGDVITRVGDAEVRSIEELRARLSLTLDSLALRLVRKGRIVEVLLRR